MGVVEAATTHMSIWEISQQIRQARNSEHLHESTIERKLIWIVRGKYQITITKPPNLASEGRNDCDSVFVIPGENQIL